MHLLAERIVFQSDDEVFERGSQALFNGNNTVS